MRKTKRLNRGDKFGKWTIVNQTEGKINSKGHISHFYLVDCDCGTKGRVVSERALKSGSSNSCGCNKSKNKDHKTIRPEPGMTFGRLTVISKAPDRIRRNGYPRYYWNVRCSCGNEKEVENHKLVSGHTVSCGCARFRTVSDNTDVKLTKYHRHYGRANNMLRRCNDTKSKSFNSYGGRGVKCLLGDNPIEVANSLDKVPGYFKGAEIDRINVNGDYTLDHPTFNNDEYCFFDKVFSRECICVGNLRWVTHKENAMNKRKVVTLDDLETKRMTMGRGKRIIKELGYKPEDFDITEPRTKNKSKEYTFKLKKVIV